MSDQQIISDLQSAFASGCEFLVIYSRRQDIGIQKCERGERLVICDFKSMSLTTKRRIGGITGPRKLNRNGSSKSAARHCRGRPTARPFLSVRLDAKPTSAIDFQAAQPGCLQRITQAGLWVRGRLRRR